MKPSIRPPHLSKLSAAPALAWAALLCSFLGLAACQHQPPPNVGRTTTYPADQRLPQERGLASKDLITATDQFVQRFASDRRTVESPTRLNIVVGEAQNMTSTPARNFDIYLARIRASLNASESNRYNMAFIAPRREVDRIRQREGLGAAGATKADYYLTSQFFDLPNAGTNFYLLTFQVTDLADGEIVFEDSYEVKFD